MNCKDKIAKQYRDSFFSDMLKSKEFTQELDQKQQDELKHLIEQFKIQEDKK